MAVTDEFQEFWAAFPRRTAKLDAVKAYAKARKVATAQDILAGVERYKRHKPDYADWCHPSTWLNKGRWLDEYDEPIVTKEYWFEECQREHGGTCEKQWAHDMKMRERA